MGHKTDFLVCFICLIFFVPFLPFALTNNNCSIFIYFTYFRCDALIFICNNSKFALLWHDTTTSHCNNRLGISGSTLTFLLLWADGFTTETSSDSGSVTTDWGISGSTLTFLLMLADGFTTETSSDSGSVTTDWGISGSTLTFLLLWADDFSTETSSDSGILAFSKWIDLGSYL